MSAQAKVYERTENGTVTHVSVREAMAEVNHAMMDGKRDVREMSSGRTAHWIAYRDGRHVRMTLVDAPAAQPAETDAKGRRIATVKGKRYIVGAVTPAQPRTPGAVSWVPEAYICYWSERNGETFGPTQHALASRRPGTVGRAIWDAANQ
jgi:hypothetical protein